MYGSFYKHQIKTIFVDSFFGLRLLKALVPLDSLSFTLPCFSPKMIRSFLDQMLTNFVMAELKSLGKRYMEKRFQMIGLNHY